MTESEIQAFLDSRVGGSCTNSSCLNIFKMNTTTTTMQTLSPGDPYGTCAPYIGEQNESAARIIYKVQRACGISAKVLLVVLQKETSLVTSKGPSDAYLQKALGYGCPDTGSCDPNYYGFFRQIYGAGRQFTWYNNPSGSHTSIKIGQLNTRYYNKNSTCGSSSVLIANKATAALYYYTPWQPNASALAGDWGVELPDKCASYGNLNFWRQYSAWFGDPTSAGSPSTARIAGDDRFATATAISKSAYPSSGVPVVYVVTGLDFPDALSAAPAAAAQGGPILLVRPGDLPEATKIELKRLAPKKIVVVGGTVAVGAGVFDALKAIQSNIQRISGADRYETSRMMASAAFPNATTSYVATGLDFPDALSASAAAGSQKIPVILLDKAPSLSAAVAASLSKMSTVKVAGGLNAVSASQEAGVKGLGIKTARFAGDDRYQTGVLINKDAFPSVKTVYVATAFAFPDALAGAAVAGASGSPLYVTMPGCVPSSVRADITGRNAQKMVLLGGPNALSDNVARLAVC
ncbi:cell wall-binding repeat-containing protein [Leifsonia sp. A12D58]|uniref:cell wall-binding repeat-containing protein n=1 Tax=Leifsonia sp. A12D58 TaxID=3397674 RepID=UPI0039DFA0FF